MEGLMVPAEFLTLDGSMQFRMVAWPPAEVVELPLMVGVRVGAPAVCDRRRKFRLEGGSVQLLTYREEME